jgi:hypothetical protein
MFRGPMAKWPFSVVQLVASTAILLICGTSSAQQAQSTGQGTTFTGRITQKDDGKPIGGATVILAPGDVKESATLKLLTTTTSADGSYRFSGVPWNNVWIYAGGAGYVSGLAGCCESPVPFASRDLQLEPALIPQQMDDSALVSEYGANRAAIGFANATFSTDGKVLQFVALDVRNNNTSLTKAWRYDVSSGVLKPGPMPVYGNRGDATWSYDPQNPPSKDADPDNVGLFHIDTENDCSGCAPGLVARNRKTGVAFTITNTETGYGSSADGKVIFWNGAAQSKRGVETVTYIFDLQSRRRRSVVLPNENPDYLTAYPEGANYLLAYSVSGPCVEDAAGLKQKVEHELTLQRGEQMNPNFNGTRLPEDLCFVIVPAP